MQDASGPRKIVIFEGIWRCPHRTPSAAPPGRGRTGREHGRWRAGRGRPVLDDDRDRAQPRGERLGNGFDRLVHVLVERIGGRGVEGVRLGWIDHGQPTLLPIQLVSSAGSLRDLLRAHCVRVLPYRQAANPRVRVPTIRPCPPRPPSLRRPARLRCSRPRARAFARALRRRLARLRQRMDERGFDRLVVYADREHSANMSYLTGFDPRFEEALLIVGPDGEPPSWSATRTGARPGSRHCPCDGIVSRISACRASRATGRGRCARSLPKRGSDAERASG